MRKSLKITKEMKILEVIKKYPKTAFVFIENGQEDHRIHSMDELRFFVFFL